MFGKSSKTRVLESIGYLAELSVHKLVQEAI